MSQFRNPIAPMSQQQYDGVSSESFIWSELYLRHMRPQYDGYDQPQPRSLRSTAGVNGRELAVPTHSQVIPGIDTEEVEGQNKMLALIREMMEMYIVQPSQPQSEPELTQPAPQPVPQPAPQPAQPPAQPQAQPPPRSTPRPRKQQRTKRRSAGPYLCDFQGCKRRFQRNYSMHKHRQSQHYWALPVQCNLCYRRFTCQDEAYHHQIHAHVQNNEPEPNQRGAKSRRMPGHR